MKNASLLLLTCLALPLCAEAKTKSKGKGAAAAKSKVIDMSAPADAGAGGGLISTELGGREVDFFLKVYELGHLETWLGEQAKTRGEADKVRAVGDALKSTQIEENEMLAKLARKKGVALTASKAPTALRKEVQSKLEKLNGAEFDQAVMEQISVATQQSVELYHVASEAPDKDIRYFAQQILPMVKEKLVLAQKVSGKAAPVGAKPEFRENAPAPPAAVKSDEESDGEFLRGKGEAPGTPTNQPEAKTTSTKTDKSQAKAGAAQKATPAASTKAAASTTVEESTAGKAIPAGASATTLLPSEKATPVSPPGKATSSGIPAPSKPTFDAASSATPAPPKPAPPTPVMHSGSAKTTPPAAK